MSKKAVFKQLRDLAEKLPRIKVNRQTGVEALSVQQAIKSGVTMVPGEKGRDIPIERIPKHAKVYVRKMELVDVNHYEKLKQAFKKDKEAGVNKYLIEVNNLVHKQSKPVNNDTIHRHQPDQTQSAQSKED